MRAFGELLWEMGRAEVCALSVLTMIQADAHLTAAERRFIESRMLHEERQHAAQTRQWARRWAPPPRAPRDPFGALIARDTLIATAVTGPSRFAWILAETHWNEQNTARAYARLMPHFRRVSPGLAQDFTQILEEEREHVRWGRRVLRRLECDDPVMARRIEVFYRLTSRIYSTVMHGQEARVMAALQEIP